MKHARKKVEKTRKYWKNVTGHWKKQHHVSFCATMSARRLILENLWILGPLIRAKKRVLGWLWPLFCWHPPPGGICPGPPWIWSRPPSPLENLLWIPIRTKTLPYLVVPADFQICTCKWLKTWFWPILDLFGPLDTPSSPSDLTFWTENLENCCEYPFGRKRYPTS